VCLGTSETRVTGEFLEWTESNHLRHSKFAGLREDKDRRQGTGGRSLSERDAILSLNSFKSLTAL
jgi:ATP-dependent DNA ligase